ncbi:MAG: DUF1553 domain-containing protein [Planctomycetia bacterium]|nr:DUF1553 domain-containing protein [Planctomycetia bacterium]
MSSAFNRLLRIAAVAGLVSMAPKPAAAELGLTLHAGGMGETPIVLIGQHARQQLVALQPTAAGPSDVTREVAWAAQPPGVVAVDSRGVVTPLADGDAVITASLAGSGAATGLQIQVRQFADSPRVHFANEVVPLLTKHGCNGGGCHGAAAGQNGFRLSLLGFEPDEDYAHLVRESRGRRLSFVLPDRSLLLAKGAGVMPHGGGARLAVGSPDYSLLRRWIAEGGQPGDPTAPTIDRIEVFPESRLMQPEDAQQLIVTAVYSDGSRRDVTATAVYEANVPEMAAVTRQGLVSVRAEPGDVAVMIRFQSQVAVFRATVPLGHVVDSLPPVRNLIDEHVFAKLKLLGLPPSPLTDEASFLRRVTIDIAGRLPTKDEVEGFLADGDPDKWDRTKSRVEDVAQLFLGQRITCAKCHHHPFDRWSQGDYHRLLAFFSQLGEKPGYSPAESRLFHQGQQAEVEHPKTKQKLTPAGLGAEPPQIPATEDPRLALVDWMTDAANPFFARAVVNRYWKHFFGRGLVDPEDDMRATNPATNPALLEALTAQFVSTGYDLKELIRLMCRSNTYRLSSEPNAVNLADRQNFSRFAPRRLPAEILADAIDTLTGVVTRYAGMPAGARAMELPDTDFSSPFLEVFGRPKGESACECERGTDANLSQGLQLLNSSDLAGKLGNGSGRANQLANAKDQPVEAKIEELYLIAYGRQPTPAETEIVIAYLDEKQHTKQAYEDLIWSLVNSKEFLFTH